MQNKGDFFIVSVYEDVTFCLSNYGQSPSHLVLYLFHQCNLLQSLIQDMYHNRPCRFGEISYPNL